MDNEFCCDFEVLTELAVKICYKNAKGVYLNEF